MARPPALFTMTEADRSLTDSDLVVKTLRGDRASFDRLIERYQRLVYSIAHRIVGNHTEADDLVQAIFLRAYSGLKSFTVGTEFRTWLYTVAVNTSLNVRKQSRRQHDLVLSAARKAPTETAGEQGADLDRQERREALERAIQTLPEDQRVALLLRIRDGLSHDQIAKICDCPTATIASRLFLARKKLEGLLREQLE